MQEMTRYGMQKSEMVELAALMEAKPEGKLVKNMKFSDYATVSLTYASPDLIVGYFLQTLRETGGSIFRRVSPIFYCGLIFSCAR